MVTETEPGRGGSEPGVHERRADAQPTIRVDAPAPRPGSPTDDLVDGVALVTLDRPTALNALSFGLIARPAEALKALNRDPSIRCIVLTGAGDRAFAAGADIKELADQTPETLETGGGFAPWGRIEAGSVCPIVAAVRGFALGGGCAARDGL